MVQNVQEISLPRKKKKGIFSRLLNISTLASELCLKFNMSKTKLILFPHAWSFNGPYLPVRQARNQSIAFDISFSVILIFNHLKCFTPKIFHKFVYFPPSLVQTIIIPPLNFSNSHINSSFCNYSICLPNTFNVILILEPEWNFWNHRCPLDKDFNRFPLYSA